MRKSSLLRCLASSTVLALAPLAVGCGGAPPPPPVSAQVPQPVLPVVPPVDVSEVPEPAGLIASVRLANPEKTVRTAASWAKLPLPSAREMLASLDEDPALSVVDLDQPVYGALSVGLKRGGVDVLAAASLGVRSLDDARTKLAVQHHVEPIDNGRWLVTQLVKKPHRDRYAEEANAEGAEAEEKSEEKTEEKTEERFACILGPAATSPTSSAPARITCGERAAVERLEPWLVRSAPRAAGTDADLHVELALGAVREPLRAFGSALPQLAGSVLGGLKPATRDLLDAAVTELVDYVTDLERATFDLRAADDGLTIESRRDFASQRSLLARWSTAHPEQGDAPPSAFWRLPRETDMAFFGRGSDPALLDRPRQLLANVVVDAATQDGLPPADARALSALLADRTLPLLASPMVYGKGFDEAGLKRAVDLKTHTPSKAGKPGDLDAAVAAQILGYHLLRVEEPITRTGPVLREWSQVLARPGFVKWMMKSTNAKKPIKARLAATQGLPKDSVHLELTIPMADRVEVLAEVVDPGQTVTKKKAAPKKTPRPPVLVHAYAVPDAGATWFAFGLDDKLVAKKASAVALGGKPEEELGSVASFAPLRSAKANAMSVFTLRALQGLFLADDKNRLAGSLALPHKGASPMTFMGRAERASATAAAGSSVGTFRMDRAAIEDLIRLAMSLK